MPSATGSLHSSPTALPTSTLGQSIRIDTLLAVLSLAMVGVGIAMRAIQYLANRSLWRDEASLALNLVERSYGELLQPLANNQVAPFGFLLAERFALSLFGDTEYALRLLPFLAGCASLLLCWAVARHFLTPRAVVLSLAFFATSPRLIWYASEVKQYSIDVAVALLLFLLAFGILNRGTTRRRSLLLGAAGAVGIWFSQPSVFIMAGVAAGLSYPALRERDWPALRTHAIIYALWAASVIPALALMRGGVAPDTLEFMESYWSRSFMPLPPTSVADLLWFPRTGRLIFSQLLGFPVFSPLLGFPVVLLGFGLLLAGCAWTWIHRREVLLCLLVPILAAAFASGLGLYPFAGRLLLFLAPSFLLLIGAGAAYLGDRFAPRSRWGGPLLAAALVAPLLAGAVPALPMYRQEIKPVLHYLAEHRRDGDAIYVYYGAERAFPYYAPRYGISAGDYHIGKRSPDEPHSYRAELDGYRGRGRTWFVFSHVRRREGVDEQQLFLEHLDSIGTRLGQLESHAAAGFLYFLP